MEKCIKNANAVTCKFCPILIRAINHRLEVAREKKQKRQKIIKRQKTEAIVAKC